MLELCCVFDLSRDQAFQGKYLKYQPLLEIITSLGYSCRCSVVILSSLGHVHKGTTKGLHIAVLSRSSCKVLLYLSNYWHHSSLEKVGICVSISAQ